MGGSNPLGNPWNLRVNIRGKIKSNIKIVNFCQKSTPRAMQKSSNRPLGVKTGPKMGRFWKSIPLGNPWNFEVRNSDQSK